MRKHGLFSLFLILATCLGPVLAVAAEPEFWLATYDRSIAVGSPMGHTALVAVPAGAAVEQGTTYGYYTPSDSVWKFARLLLAEEGFWTHPPLSMEVIPFVQTRLIENVFYDRSVVLIRLNLSEAQRQALKASLDQDQALLNANYDLINDNCLITLLRHLNKVLPPEQQFPLNKIKLSSNYGFKAFRSTTYSTRVPVAFLRDFEKHPIVSTDVKVFPRWSLERAQRMANRVNPTMKALFQCQGWQEKSRLVLDGAVVEMTTENKPELFPPMKSLLVRAKAECARSRLAFVEALASVVDIQHTELRLLVQNYLLELQAGEGR